MALEIEDPVVGRTADIVFLDSPNIFKLNTADQSIFNSGGKMAAGAFKLMQQVVLLLFTPDGFRTANSFPGSTLASAFLRGQLQSEAAVANAFAVTRERIRDYMAVNTQSDAADEQLLDVTLISVEFRDSALYLTINITTQAGQPLTVLLPVTAHV